MAGYGYRGARTAVRLIDDPSRFLATVQIGITLVGILAGAFGGAMLAYRLGDWLNGFPALAPNGDSIAIAVVVDLTAYLSLIAAALALGRESCRESVCPSVSRLALAVSLYTNTSHPQLLFSQ